MEEKIAKPPLDIFFNVHIKKRKINKRVGAFGVEWLDEQLEDILDWACPFRDTKECGRGKEKGKCTFRACRRACSSSRAACFSLSSTLVKDMPVLAREETALERVLALEEKKEG